MPLFRKGGRRVHRGATQHLGFRGGMDALMAEVIEGHIRFHILPLNGGATDEQRRAADDLVTALRAYLK